jgi:hypothetical protein
MGISLFSALPPFYLPFKRGVDRARGAPFRVSTVGIRRCNKSAKEIKAPDLNRTATLQALFIGQIHIDVTLDSGREIHASPLN